MKKRIDQKLNSYGPWWEILSEFLLILAATTLTLFLSGNLKQPIDIDLKSSIGISFLIIVCIFAAVLSRRFAKIQEYRSLEK